MANSCVVFFTRVPIEFTLFFKLVTMGFRIPDGVMRCVLRSLGSPLNSASGVQYDEVRGRLLRQCSCVASRSSAFSCFVLSKLIKLTLALHV